MLCSTGHPRGQPDGTTGRLEVLAVLTNGEDVPADEDIEPVRLKVLAQVRGDRSYVAPDVHVIPGQPTAWQVGNTPKENLMAGRGAFVLAPVPKSISLLLHAEWSTDQPVIEPVLLKVVPAIAKTGFPLYQGPQLSMKLQHEWYEQRDPMEMAQIAHGTLNTSGEDGAAVGHQGGFDHTLVNVHAPFRIANLPVHPENRPALLEAVVTHKFNPLCAFMYGHTNKPLHPDQYHAVLLGAIVQVTFTLSHRLMKRPHNTSSHFAANIDQVGILQIPHRISLSPSKETKKNLFHKRGPDAGPGPSSNASAKRPRVA
ncbi:hypothetical protein FRC06_007339 [Ceratobasidium sp. 370]|nr:hypothetical protein FRC06_007339 [Ceratobasidium sp. 370]